MCHGKSTRKTSWTMSSVNGNEGSSSNEEVLDLEPSVLLHRSPHGHRREIQVLSEPRVESSLPHKSTRPGPPRSQSLGQQPLHSIQREKHGCDPSGHQEEQEELPAVVPINVGGHRFMTRLSTLRKYEDSMLSVMFSGRHKLDKDKNGYYFLDSNGTFFGFILDFLRHETLPPGDISVQVYKEACYYNIPSLIEKLQCTPAVAKMMVKESHRAQFPDYFGLKQKVIKIAMDNATVDKVGEVIIHAYRKDFVPRATYFNVNHECVADSAHISVGPWESTADEEILIKCLETDFIEEGFNIKAHEQKRRCKYYNGQNCQKSIYKIIFIFS